jgi:D-alanyl-D-alanine dipeptidase
VPPAALHLVDLREFAPGVLFDLRYTQADNFFGQALYSVAAPLLARDTARKLVAAQAWLRERGYGLLVWDAYRPLSVQARMWALMPDERYVARPELGSRHNRAAAVDVTLVDALGREVAMPTPYDTFTPQAAAECPSLAPEVRARALLLRLAMTVAGFTFNPAEWWHFSDRAWENYPLLDLPLGVPVPPS